MGGGVKGRKGGEKETEVERKVCVCATCVRAKLLQLCPTFFHPMDCSLRGSSVHGILQAKLPEWVATPSFRGSSLPRDQPLSLTSSAAAGRFFAISATRGKPKRRSNSNLR